MMPFIELSSSKNNEPVIDSAENFTDESESELVNISDHSYGISEKISGRTKRSSVHEVEIETPDIAAKAYINSSEQSSCRTNYQQQI